MPNYSMPGVTYISEVMKKYCNTFRVLSKKLDLELTPDDRLGLGR